MPRATLQKIKHIWVWIQSSSAAIDTHSRRHRWLRGQHLFAALFLFDSCFVLHLNSTCTVESTSQKWGRQRPYCPCTPDLALGHGDCAVKVELHGFLRLWKPVYAFRVSQKCQLPEIQDVTELLDAENTGLWTLKAAARTVDGVTIWVARSTLQ